MAELLQQLLEIAQRVWGKVSGLYAPEPMAAQLARRHLPQGNVSGGPKTTAVVSADAVGAGGRIWQSGTLDTAGWTCQNALGEILIDQDLLGAVDTSAQPMSLWLVLEGQAHGSPVVEISRSRAVPYTGLGRYAFSLASSGESLAMDIRASIWALSPDPEMAGRQIRFEVSCQLVAGYTF